MCSIGNNKNNKISFLTTFSKWKAFKEIISCCRRLQVFRIHNYATNAWNYSICMVFAPIITYINLPKCRYVGSRHIGTSRNVDVIQYGYQPATYWHDDIIAWHLGTIFTFGNYKLHCSYSIIYNICSIISVLLEILVKRNENNTLNT